MGSDRARRRWLSKCVERREGRIDSRGYDAEILCQNEVKEM